MSELVHYTNPQSRGMRTKLLLDTFDIPHREVVVEFAKGETHTPEYLKIHPYGRVPALVDGDVTVIESGAIILYLADRFPEKCNTPGPGTPDRARLYEWVMFFQATLEPLAITSFSGADKDELKGKLRDLLVAMESRLTGPYALGEEFSLVDTVIGCELMWYQMMGLYPDGLDGYDAYLARIAPRLKFPAQA